MYTPILLGILSELRRMTVSCTVNGFSLSSSRVYYCAALRKERLTSSVIYPRPMRLCF